jgi:putative transcriptional regulator
MSLESLKQREIEAYHLLLAEYAAGTLDMAHSLLVSAHLSLSCKGRSFVKNCESLGGILIEQHCEPVEMSCDSLQNVLARLDAGTTPPSDATQSAKHGPTLPTGHSLPECVQGTLKTCCDKEDSRVHWKVVYPGMRIAKLPLACNRSKAHVIKVSPGKASPYHRHKGMEITLILDGAIIDDGGTYTQGDVMIRSEEDMHNPRSCEKSGCVCLVVGSEGIALTGLLKLLNPFVRI